VGAITVDPADWLCSRDACPALDDDERPLFKDQTHIRASVVRDGFTALDGFVYLPAATGVSAGVPPGSANPPTSRGSGAP
jgi:hypothetical protein